MKLRYLAAILLLFCSLFLCGQDQQLRFRGLSTDEGLSQGIVTDIVEDSKGFIWVGTMNGLNRLVGHDVKIFRSSNRDSLDLPSDQIRTLTAGSDGKIWIGTADAGLCCLDTRVNKIEVPQFINSENKNVTESQINRIVIADTEDVWAAAGKNGVFHLDMKNNTTHVYEVYLSDKQRNALNITDLFFDQGELWLGTSSNGMVLFDPDTGIVRQYTGQNLKKSHDFSEVLRAIPGTYPWIWVSTKRSFVHKFNRLSGEAKVYDQVQDTLAHHRTVYDLLFQGPDTLWMATTDGGLQRIFLPDERIDIVSHTNHILGIAYNSLNALYRSSDNILWVGTNGKGLSYHHPGMDRFTVYSKTRARQYTLDFESVRSIYADDDWIFMGGYFGLNRFHRETGEKANWMSALTPYSICEVEGNPKLLLLGMEGHFLILLDKQIGPIQELNIGDLITNEDEAFLLGFVYKIVHLQDSQYLLGHSGGLAIYDLEKEQVIKNFIANEGKSGIPQGEIKSISRDQQGHFWIGSVSGGLAKFNPVENNFIRADSLNGYRELPSNQVLCTHIDQQGSIWVGTPKGLAHFSAKSGLIYNYSVVDGLPNNNISGIEEDLTGTIWCSSDEGISRLDSNTGRITNYNKDHGLPCNEFNRGANYTGKDNLMYFGGVDGAVSFTAEPTMLNFSLPHPQVVRYMSGNEEVRLDTLLPYCKEIIVKPKEKYLSFEVSGMDYLLEDHNKFQYSIPEISRVWLNAKDGNIPFTDPKPGTYHLRVRVSNDNSNWVEMPEPLLIRVKPTIWQTRAARLIFLLIAIGLIVLVIYFRTLYLTRQKLELNKLVNSRTAELLTSEAKLQEANASKDRFFSIIAHDLKSPFNSLLGLSQLLSEGWEDFSDAKKQEMILMMKGNLTNAYELLTNLLDWSRLQRDTITAAIQDVDLYQLAQASVEGFEVQITAKGISVKNEIFQDLHAMGDPLMVETIFRNLLSNAIKFTPHNGEICLRSMIQDGKINCSVTDNGIGMDEEILGSLFHPDRAQSRPGTEGEKGTGLGLLVCREFVHLMQGELKVESVMGSGSTYCFSLPEAPA